MKQRVPRKLKKKMKAARKIKEALVVIARMTSVVAATMQVYRNALNSYRVNSPKRS